MNLILIPAPSTPTWCIEQPRQVQHLTQHLKVAIGDTLKVGILNQASFNTKIIAIEKQKIWVEPIQALETPKKLPVTLIIALPRPKVLRRLIMDSVSLGVEKLVVIHSYRVDKSYWQSPLLTQLDHYVQLGLEQATDVMVPEIKLEKRLKPFVEDHLAHWTTAQKPSFVAHPYHHHPMPNAWNQPCHLIIGPEGGFIPYEIELFKQNGCQIMSLGNRILRTETAVPFALARLYTNYSQKTLE